MGSDERSLSAEAVALHNASNAKAKESAAVFDVDAILKELQTTTDRLFIDIADGFDAKESEILSVFTENEHVEFVEGLRIFCVEEVLPRHLCAERDCAYEGAAADVSASAFTMMSEADLT